MRLRKASWITLLVVALLVSHVAARQGEAADAETQTTWGLKSTTFNTRHGRVVVNLPGDAAAGDTLSGTVYAEPAGDDDETRERNRERLQELSVAAGGLSGSVAQGVLRGAVTGTQDGGALPVSLRGPEGEVVARGEVPLASAAAPPPPGPSLPELAQAGRPVTIRGPFDGNAGTTTVEIDGKPAVLLAESPRGAVIQAPADTTGRAELRVQEEGSGETPGFEGQGTLRILGLALSAGSVDLRRGQRTGLQVRVTGLEGLEREVPLEIRNQSPSRVRLEGGDVQRITIPPDGVSAGGDHVWSGTLIGIGPGAFEIVAAVPFLLDPSGVPDAVADALQDPDQNSPNCACQRLEIEDATSPSTRNTVRVDEWRRDGRPVGISLVIRRPFLHRIVCTGTRGECSATTRWTMAAPEVTLRGVHIDGEPSADLSSSANRAEERLALGPPRVGYDDEAEDSTLTLTADCDECRRERRRECKNQFSRGLVHRLDVELPLDVLNRLRAGASVTFAEVEVAGRWGSMAPDCGPGFTEPAPHRRVQERPAFTGWK